MSREEVVDLEERRRRAREIAQSRLHEADRQLGARQGSAPGPGDLYRLPASGELPVEWAVLVVEPATAQALVVPVDTCPLVGSADVAVPAGTTAGPASLRCGHGVWLPLAQLEAPGAARSGLLEPQSVAAAQAKRQRLEAGLMAGTTAEQEVDLDPEYEDWVEDVLRPARRALEAGRAEVEAKASPAARAKEPSTASRLGGVPPRWLALAATVLLAVTTSLGGALWWQQGRLAALEEQVAGTEQLREELATLESRRRAEGVEARRERERLERELAEARGREAIAPLPESEQPPPPAKPNATPATPQPVLNPRLEWFQPRRDEVRAGPRTERVVTPAGGWLYVVLEVWSPVRYPHYRVELTSREGDVLWTTDELTLQGAGEIVFGLPARLLPPGEHRFRLQGLAEGQAELLEDYPFRVAVP